MAHREPFIETAPDAIRVTTFSHASMPLVIIAGFFTGLGLMLIKATQLGLADATPADVPWVLVVGVLGLVVAVPAFWFGLFVIAGRAIITIDRETLEVRTGPFGIGRARQYPAAECSGITVVQAGFRGAVSTLVFEFPNRTVRAGIGMTQAEADTALEAIRAHLSAL